MCGCHGSAIFASFSSMLTTFMRARSAGPVHTACTAGWLVRLQHRVAPLLGHVHSQRMAVGFLDLPARGEYSVAQYRGAEVFVAESSYPPGLFIAPHAHRGATLTAILGG